MTKGQKRSNREVRKPKQQKSAPQAEGTFANQIKAAASTNTGNGKGRR